MASWPNLSQPSAGVELKDIKAKSFFKLITPIRKINKLLINKYKILYIKLGIFLDLVLVYLIKL